MHDLDASHPGTLCGSVLDARRPVSAVPGAPRGPEGGPKMRIVTFRPFRPPKRPRGRSSSKYKSYLRYRNGLWRFNRDFNFFRFGSRTFACCADMGPPTGNRGAPGATSGPLFPSNMTLQESNWVGPIFICGFRVAAKLAFSDQPLAPRGPKKGQKGPFGATHAKNGIDRLEANGISVV